MTFKIIVNQRVGDVIAQNRLIFDGLLGDPSNKTAFADAIRAMYASVANRLHPLWSLESITYTELVGAGSFSEVIDFTDGELSGTATGELLPTQVALLLSTSSLSAPPNRGRIYIPAMTEANCANGLFNATVRNDFENAFGALFDGSLPGAVDPSILHIARLNAQGNTLISANPVSGLIARESPGTVRNRRR